MKQQKVSNKFPKEQTNTLSVVHMESASSAERRAGRPTMECNQVMK